MERAIVEFKSRSVQRPQRQKVAVRRALDEHVRSIRAIEKVATLAADQNGGRLPASESNRTLRNAHGIRQALEALETEVVLDDRRSAQDLGYELELTPDGLRIRAEVGEGLLSPTISVWGTKYRVGYAAGALDDPAVIVRNRPRSIVFNTGHLAYATGDRARKFELALALELAYLLDSSDAASVYEQMMTFVEVM
jgi:hypothetical protein